MQQRMQRDRGLTVDMSHLPDERLAALLDDPPTSAELAHLASCERCATERAAYRALRELSNAEQHIGAPLSDWDTLAPALRADGVIDTGEWRVARRPRRFGGVWSQAAAAVLIAIGGIAYGRYSAVGSVLPGSAHPMKAFPAKAARDSSAFSSIEEARTAQEQAQTLYQSAALYLAAHDTLELSPDSPAAMRHQLATLDEVGETVRQALVESPGDPVINGYYLTTLGQREATLRQLNASLPVGVRVNMF